MATTFEKTPGTPDQFSERHQATLAAMIHYGGSFVRRIGKAWQVADASNHDRLYAAFPEYYAQYITMAGVDKAMREVRS